MREKRQRHHNGVLNSTEDETISRRTVVRRTGDDCISAFCADMSNGIVAWLFSLFKQCCVCDACVEMMTKRTLLSRFVGETACV